MNLDTAEALARALTDQHALLVLDNCEELADACRTLIEVLLASCPHLVVLATSRTSLHPALEHLMALPPMHATAEKDERSDAADLFYDRAGRVLPAYPHHAGDLATVNRLCERLDGLPLAIELAAPWVRTLSARDLLIEIERSADLLASTQPTLTGRHQSMRAVWDSTWRSLTADEQRVLSSLSVFRGGFTAEAAEAVAAASPVILRSLSDRALIRPPTESVNRYELHELVRQYADDVLQGDGPATVAAVRQAHLDYFLRLYERALPDVDTPRERQWTSTLRVELPNAGAALGWALDSVRVEPALRMTAALTPVWVGLAGMGPYLARLRDRAGPAVGPRLGRFGGGASTRPRRGRVRGDADERSVCFLSFRGAGGSLRAAWRRDRTRRGVCPTAASPCAVRILPPRWATSGTGLRSANRPATRSASPG